MLTTLDVPAKQMVCIRLNKMNLAKLEQFIFITISIGWKDHEGRACCTNAIRELIQPLT